LLFFYLRELVVFWWGAVSLSALFCWNFDLGFFKFQTGYTFQLEGGFENVGWGNAFSAVPVRGKNNKKEAEAEEDEEEEENVM
jgi:hypothetical protein